MRTINILAALVIVLGTVVNANANTTGTELKVWETKAKTFRLIYKSEAVQTVKVNILDGDNKVLHTQKVKSTDGFMLPINMSKLPSGEYTVEIVSGNEVERRSIKK